MTVVEAIKDVIKFAGDIPEKFDAMKEKAQAIASALVAPFVAVKDAVQDIIDKIAAIKLPSIDIPGFDFLADPLGRGFGAGATTGTPTAAAAKTVINVTVTQTIGDPVAAAREIRAILNRAERITL